MLTKVIRLVVVGLILSTLFTPAARAQQVTLRVQTDAPGRPISPDLFGIFFEDLNYAADGGLYAELIQNRSFEYQATEQPTWNSLSFWELTKRGGGEGKWAVEYARPLHPNNPHYLALEVTKVADGVGLVNPGFDGIALRAGETYDLSLFARQLFMNRRWPPDNSIEGRPMSLAARLESKDGEVLCEAPLQVVGREWTRLTAALTPSRDEEAARLVLLAKANGGIALDEISLFPRKTFRDRPNGLRADLAQTIADLRPKFIRFPGGCLVHGNGTGNFYDWKETIGPVEQRRGQANLWGYHQSVGLGYFEYFQFAEDIGAKPLPVVAAGVSCQNSDHTGEVGQQCLAIADMPAYIQDILDLIEWANGPAASRWGAKRAAAGHPRPFNLEYLGVGNEDVISEEFRVRFKMIRDAVKKKYPEITVVGTVGPFPDGTDYEAGWKFADEQRLEMVDEHGYKPPEWYWRNLTRFDRYDRAKSKVYLGEFAAHDTGRANTLRSALAEAAYMTSLERNGDIVRLASYAPLLARQGHTQWRPDLIYFDGTRVLRTANYYVQQLFSLNQGDAYLTSTLTGVSSPDEFAVSSVRDGRTGDIIIKLVNGNSAPRPLLLELSGAKRISRQAIKTVLAGEAAAVNGFDAPARVAPVTSGILVDRQFEYEAPAHSLTVIRIKTR
ncbi:MAG TPA: alpha-L-arabinofuranosidase C-terminal domain-containing protein [Pyrinomonadaceae bacterium]